MKKILKRWIVISVLAISLIVMVVLQLSFIKTGVATLPNALCFKSQSGMDINFDQAEKCNSDTLMSSGYVTLNSSLNTDYNTTPMPIKLTLTNSSYNKLVPLNMMYGAYFYVDDVPEYNRVAVISSELAVRLFQTYDAVGKTVHIDDTEYIVCGVYLDDKSLLRSVLSDGSEQVYVPYKGIVGYEKQPIKRLYLYSENSVFPEGLVEKVEVITNSNLRYNSVSNYTETSLLLKQSFKVSLFICAVILISIMYSFIVKWIKKAMIQIHGGMESLHSKKSFIISILICFLIALLMGIIFWLVKFDLFIPASILPYDNIFDFKFYFETISNNIQTINSYEIFDFYWNYSIASLLISALNSIITCVLFFAFALNTMSVIKEIKKE